MDYSYFTPVPQPFQFLGLPPTPAHSQTPQVDDCIIESPPNTYDPAVFLPFEPPFRFDPNAPNPPPLSPTKAEANTALEHTTGMDGGGPALDIDNDPTSRDSSEEKDNLTPALSRRKAQNRAAQRAFRERKERHVKDLEQKLTSLEHASTTLASDNERLKRELEKIATENEILRATYALPKSHSDPHRTPLVPSATNGPTSYSPTQFYTTMLSDHPSHPSEISHKITVSNTTGERLLAAGATWDLIQAHPSFKAGLVDIGDVSERLKKSFQCDGQGPVFAEGDIRRAVEESVAAGSDELI
ncbi:hypothetical protein MMC16_006978 [Acarospora aff. strigata]|nr:hypothetical protein [Acarospora aff. strigata]